MNLAKVAVNMMGQEKAAEEALSKLFTAFQWLDAVGAIEFLDFTLLADGKFRLRFRDAAGAPQEFVVPGTPSWREAYRKEKEKAQQE